ncbi:MAG: hypothetical protein AB7I50_14940 [Vicinamibacterales bacterium]
MKRSLFAVLALGLASSAAAAPNVTNVTQKGSLLVFPDIRVDDFLGNYALSAWANQFDTLVRIQNDGSSDVDVKCYWMDGHKNRVDFIIPVTRNQAVWFDARTGRGSTQVNPFPTGAANGFTAGNRHPFLEVGGALNLPAPPAQLGTGAPAYTAPVGDGYGPYRRGLLACWVIDGGAQNQVKWNHLSGTATVYGNVNGAYEYSAYAFFVPTGTDLAPVGVAGALNLNGLEYDACPLYQIGQFTPSTFDTTTFGPGYGTFPAAATPPPPPLGAPALATNRLAVTGCNLHLNQDWTPVWTKLQFDVWNEEEVKFTGAFECADSWHDTDFRPGAQPQNNASLTPGVPGFVDGLDAAGQNFDFATLATYAARYRVQGVKSSQCDRTKGTSNDTVAAVTTQAVGLVAVQSSLLLSSVATVRMVGTTLVAAGKFNGKVVWDPEGVVPEGAIK